MRLLVVAVCGLLCARLVSTLLSDVLRVERSVREVTAPIVDRVSTVDTSVFAARNVFGAARDVVIEEPEPPSLSAACERSALNARLVATVVSIDPDRSVAVFGADEAYYRGDLLLDRAKIVQIGFREVRVDNEGRCETFAFDEAAPQLAAAVVIEPGDTRIIPRSEIEAALADLNRIATDARIVPYVKDGVPQGFRLFSIRPGSLYTRLGLQNGDVIQRLNNHDLSDPAVAYETYLKLKDASTISVDLLRGGKKQSLNYELR